MSEKGKDTSVLKTISKRTLKITWSILSFTLILAIIGALTFGPELYIASNTISPVFGDFWVQLQQHHGRFFVLFTFANIITMVWILSHINNIADGHKGDLGMDGATYLNIVVGMSRYMAIFVPVYFIASYNMESSPVRQISK